MKLTANEYLNIYSLFSPQRVLPLHTGERRQSWGPSVCVCVCVCVCVECYMSFFKDGGFSVAAAKVMKRANSKGQSEDSCSCMFTEHK